MSGTEEDVRLAQLEAILDRRVPIESLSLLSAAVGSKQLTTATIGTTALGIDANVFLKLGSHPKRDDIVDYLDTKHVGPVIVPGQVVQEFWNNQLAAVATVSKVLERKFRELATEIAKIDAQFGTFASDFQALLDRFNAEYGYVYDEATLRGTESVLNMLARRASLVYVPRVRFAALAASRRKTKTPPGFKDDGDGDFFVWAEFLYGALLAIAGGARVDQAIMVTNDTKVDWSRAGIAHPILSAEVRALLNVPFFVWTLDELAAAVAAQVAA